MNKKPKISEKKYFNQFYSQKPGAFEDSLALKKQAEIYFSKISNSTRPKKSDSVLSLGCANGRFELRFASFVGKITGLDISSKAIANAKQSAKKSKIKNADFYVHDITKGLPFKDESFNQVLALGIFHHIDMEKLSQLLKEINRVLKFGGHLYTIDPNANGILRIIARTFFKKTYQSYRSPLEYDIDNKKLASMCLKVGFKIEKLDFLDFCLSETAYLWPNLAIFFSDLLLLVDRVWCNFPLIKGLSSQFSLLCRKMR